MCFDLLEEMHNTNTEITNIWIGLFSVVRNGFVFTKKLTFKEYHNEFLDTDESSDTDFG
jgi:hypothetical protein